MNNSKFSVFAEAVWVCYLVANTCALWISVWRTCRRLHSIENTDKTTTETWMLTPVLLGRWVFWLVPRKSLNLWTSLRVGKAALGPMGMTWLSWAKEGHCCPQRSTAKVPGNPGVISHEQRLGRIFRGILGVAHFFAPSYFIHAPLHPFSTASISSNGCLHPLGLNKFIVQWERAEGSHSSCSLHLYRRFCFRMATTCSWPGLNWLFFVQKSNAHAQNFYRGRTVRWCGLCPSPDSWGLSLGHLEALPCPPKSEALRHLGQGEGRNPDGQCSQGSLHMGSPELRRAGMECKPEVEVRWTLT